MFENLRNAEQIESRLELCQERIDYNKSQHEHQEQEKYPMVYYKKMQDISEFIAFKLGLRKREKDQTVEAINQVIEMKIK